MRPAGHPGLQGASSLRYGARTTRAVRHALSNSASSRALITACPARPYNRALAATAVSRFNRRQAQVR